jgi:hypothetical protein
VDHQTNNTFKIISAKSILDRFDDLHHNILFYDADTIYNANHVIDRQHTFWKQSGEDDFYGLLLIQELNGSFTRNLELIRLNLFNLIETENT